MYIMEAIGVLCALQQLKLIKTQRRENLCIQSFYTIRVVNVYSNYNLHMLPNWQNWKHLLFLKILMVISNLGA